MKNKQNNLNQLIKQRQIVQHYPVQYHPSHHYPTLYHNQHPNFYEDQIFQELQRTAIVEDYQTGPTIQDEDMLMDIQEPDCRMEEQEPYQEYFPQQKTPFPAKKINILDSESSGHEFPERKSSISSIQSQTEKQSFSPLLMRAQTSKYQAESFFKPERTGFHEQRKARPRREIDSSVQKKQRLGKIKKLQEIGCNCKKSRCLKMYCECFNLQILCGSNCNCVDCGNMSENAQHQKAVLDALTRNPKAFAEDAQAMPTVFQLGLQLSEVKKGCKCRKTQCRKKYCECFSSGQPCGVFCQCQGCLNLPSPR